MGATGPFALSPASVGMPQLLLEQVTTHVSHPSQSSGLTLAGDRCVAGLGAVADELGSAAHLFNVEDNCDGTYLRDIDYLVHAAKKSRGHLSS